MLTKIIIIIWFDIFRMEDTAMINEELGAVSLCDYVNQYTGYQKIVRLQSLINDGHNIDEKTVVEAI